MSELGFAPKHILIADKMRDYIMSGKVKSGERLQADTVLATKFKVNKRTIANGLNLLAEEGLLSRAPGRGFCGYLRKRRQIYRSGRLNYAQPRACLWKYQ